MAPGAFSGWLKLHHGCQMAIDIFLDCMRLALRIKFSHMATLNSTNLAAQFLVSAREREGEPKVPGAAAGAAAAGAAADGVEVAGAAESAALARVGGQHRPLAVLAEGLK